MARQSTNTKPPSENPASLSVLPIELIALIISYLNTPDIIALASTSTSFHKPVICLLGYRLHRLLKAENTCLRSYRFFKPEDHYKQAQKIWRVYSVQQRIITLSTRPGLQFLENTLKFPESILIPLVEDAPKRFYRATKLTCESQCRELVKWAVYAVALRSNSIATVLLNNLKRTPPLQKARFLDYTCLTGNTDLLQYLLEPDNEFGFTPNQNTLNAAANSGKLEMLSYLLDLTKIYGTKRLTPNQDTLCRAAQSGNLEMLSYLLNLTNLDGTKRLMPNQDTLEAAARSGNLDMLSCLLGFNKPDGTPLVTPNKNTLCRAARSGSLKILLYLLDLTKPDGTKRLVPDPDTLDAALQSGNPHLFEFLLSWQYIPLISATHNGNLSVQSCLAYLIAPHGGLCYPHEIDDKMSELVLRKNN